MKAKSFYELDTDPKPTVYALLAEDNQFNQAIISKILSTQSCDVLESADSSLGSRSHMMTFFFR